MSKTSTIKYQAHRDWTEANVLESYEVARAFVQNKARVIMINRKEEQGNDAIAKIKEEVGEHAQIEWLPCDLGSLKEVKEVFSGIREREKRLDLVRIRLPNFDLPDSKC